MQRDTLSLFMSLIALILSVFYFLSFYSFKDSGILKYDNENIYLDKKRTYLCDDIRDKNSCKYIFYENKMINLGRNNEGNNLLINKNAMICNDVNNINSCSCLSNKCDFQKQLNHFTFIDKPIAFNDNNYGLLFGGRVIPIENRNTFTFSTWININIIDIDNWRTILSWRKSKNQVNPAILISPKEWSSCSSKIDIRFSNLNDDENLNGTFNIVNDNHGHCIRDTIYYYFKWFHLSIVGNKNKLQYWINGNLVQEEDLVTNFKIGDEEDKIYIGGSPDYSAEGIILAKTRWYSKPLNYKEINLLFKEDYE